MSSTAVVIGSLTDFNLETPQKGNWQIVQTRAREILKSESVQPMTMTSSMSPFPKKKYVYITCHEN